MPSMKLLLPKANKESSPTRNPTIIIWTFDKGEQPTRMVSHANSKAFNKELLELRDQWVEQHLSQLPGANHGEADAHHHLLDEFQIQILETLLPPSSL